MEQWVNWPWVEMLTATVLLSGAALSLLLLLNKFPASRFLGQLIIAYLAIALIMVSDQAPVWLTLSLVFIALSFNWYASSFFTQNTRINRRQVWLVLSALFMAGFCYHFRQILLANSIIYGLVVLLLLGAIRIVKKEASRRGVFWFQNPGTRIVWFRNYIFISLFSIIGLVISIDKGNAIFLLLIILINTGFVYYQILIESSFLAPLPIVNKYKKSTLSASQKSAILEKLNKHLAESKFYLKDDASLSKLAEELHTTIHHLSQVLNESKGISFQELISQNRIREARHLLKDPALQQSKVENIAAMVGYNSKSAFNTAFKRHTGTTPSEYRDSKDVRSYREELLPDKKRRMSPQSTFSLSHLFTVKLKHNMVTNFFKTFLRSLKRNKVFTFINLLGLTVGFACSLLIYLFISDELSYDRGLPNNENIYRISWFGESPQTRTPHPMAQAMRSDFPEVENAVSLSPWYGPGLTRENLTVKNENLNISFEEPDFFFADSTFFDVFQLEVLAGDVKALHKPNTLVITKTLANKYFNQTDAVGQILTVADMPFEVSAVVEGMPKNSHFHFNALIPYMMVKQINPEDHWMTWGDFGHFNYVVLNPQSSAEELTSKIGKWVLRYLNWGEDAKEQLASGERKFGLQPITDIHMYSHLRWELENNGNILYVYILSGTMIFILIIAAINYINLTTAKSVERAKEIGVRKTLGAVSGNLTFQFYLESVIFCFMALTLAYAVTLFLLPIFNDLSHKTFEHTDLFNISFLGRTSAICLAIGLVAGFYPALYLSSFVPSEVLKGKLSAGGSNNRLRSLLVVCQFVVSAILITASLIIINQIEYMKSKELGFNQSAVISIPIPSSVEYGGINLSQVRTIQNQLATVKGVRSIAAASNLPGSQFNNHSISTKNQFPTNSDVSELYVDYDLVELFDFKLMKGRSFNRSFDADSAGTNVLINEAAAKALSLDEPIGEKLNWHLDGFDLDVTVVGVVKDFHFKSLHQSIDPLIIQYQPYLFNFMIVKLEGKSFQASLSAIEKVYGQIDPDYPFEYHFLDQQLADLYEREVRTLSIFSIFAAIALGLACLGLLGIALAMLSQKVKEVGIRKIMGASPFQIIQMIFAQFIKLISIALAIGLPTAHLLMQNWLAEFSYQATFGVMPFVWSAIVLLLVAIASVSVVVTKIAATNPVRALRYE